MTEENNSKRKKSTKYLLIGVLVLFLSILGASVAYYLARISGNLSGRAAGTELTINVQKVSSNATGDLIPLDNDLETLNLAAAGYQDKGACVDINGYSVCQIYHITLTNKGSVPLTVNGTVTLSGQNVPNIDCARMNNETTVANNNSCMGGNVFVSGDTLAANDHNDYYVMVYINNLDEPQTDSGAFNGTVTFTTEDGRKVKGRFTKPFNLAERITTLYNVNNTDLVTTTAKSKVTNNEIEYNYATNVGLMNDRLGGTTTSLDGGNIRYFGAEPNNWIDIGDKTEVEVTQGNWESWFPGQYNNETDCLEAMQNMWNAEAAAATGYATVDEFCSVSTISAGTPILWRIIGVFDGKLRIRRDENIGAYSFDTSASDINDGYGINEWSQSDLMKLLNPGYESESVGGSLYWNSGSGNCYKGYNNSNINCDFTNTGLSDDAKEYVIDQTVYLGGFDKKGVFANEAWTIERGTNVFNSTKECVVNGESYCNDTVTRTLSWTGKVAIIYPSDFGYAADFSDNNCQGTIDNFSSCIENWMTQDMSWTVSPWSETARSEMAFSRVSNITFYDNSPAALLGGWPTLLLDSSALAESGNGSKEHPYVLTS